MNPIYFHTLLASKYLRHCVYFLQHRIFLNTLHTKEIISLFRVLILSSLIESHSRHFYQTYKTRNLASLSMTICRKQDSQRKGN